MPTSTLTTPETTQLLDQATRSTLDLILAPLYEVAQHSPSLLASRHHLPVREKVYDIPKFLLLGQRGGGRPIRLAFFAGLDAGSLVSTAALARLLLQYELSPALARDFALFAYPVVNAGGFEEEAQPLAEFEHRYGVEKPEADVRFFKSELREWTFDGLITLRSDAKASGFHAKVRSQVIGREVALPALQVLGRTLPLEAQPVTLRSEDRLARFADHTLGKLTPLPGSAPQPFEIEIFAPEEISTEQRIVGLFLFVQETLRNYRKIVAHAPNL
jgi:murein peptide amidase A